MKKNKNICFVCRSRKPAKNTFVLSDYPICEECDSIYLYAYADAWTEVKKHQKLFGDNEAELMRMVRDASKLKTILVYGRSGLRLKNKLLKEFPKRIKINNKSRKN